jgi:oxygen-independent coproporphyrinogen-3 oxidase
MISPDVFAKYAAMRVPRYTSYPTAPHFSAAVDEIQYRSWLRALLDEPVSIYLHIPFCREMCWYCGCHTTVTRRRAPVSRNAATLAREIGLF